MSAAVAVEGGGEPPAGRTALQLLATGGMAEVHLARRAGAGGAEILTAVKRLRPDRAGDPDAAAMFRDEARIGALCAHPNVARVLSTGDDEAGPFIEMEFVPGEELSELCRRGGASARMPGPWEAAEIGRQAASALAHVHELCDERGPLGVVHGDVSPPNLLVTAGGQVVLIDFGVARDRLTGPSRRTAGKLAYMAPEQAAGGEPDARADVFALGVILWELLAGARLLRGPADEVRRRLERGDVPRPSSARPECPAELERVVMGALARDPEGRPSARELEAALRGAAERAGDPGGPALLARYVESIGISERMRLGGAASSTRAQGERAQSSDGDAAAGEVASATPERSGADSRPVTWLLVVAGMVGVAVLALSFAIGRL